MLKMSQALILGLTEPTSVVILEVSYVEEKLDDLN